MPVGSITSTDGDAYDVKSRGEKIVLFNVDLGFVLGFVPGYEPGCVRSG
jgi:hypothetical protein